MMKISTMLLSDSQLPGFIMMKTLRCKRTWEVVDSAAYILELRFENA